jgi:2-oxoglutarate ferredoxin oxidoreductase subunit beta
MAAETTVASGPVNQVGLTRGEYKGLPSTLCSGCGHNAISNQIIAAMYEVNAVPEKVMKFSGIGCSSKSPTYFLGRSFSFNGLHGRMPSMALGAIFADTSVRGIGVSGDGDSAGTAPASGWGSSSTWCGATCRWYISWKTTACTG